MGVHLRRKTPPRWSFWARATNNGTDTKYPINLPPILIATLTESDEAKGDDMPVLPQVKKEEELNNAEIVIESKFHAKKYKTETADW